MNPAMRALTKVSALIFVCAVIIGASLPVQAQSTASPASTAPSSKPAAGDEETPAFPPTPQQLSFAKQYVKAVNGKDLDGLRRLIVPQTMACYTDRTRPFLDDWLSLQFKDPISSPYTITVEPRNADDFPHSALVTLPVMPSNQLNIATRLRGEDVVLGRPITYREGRWYLAGPCPTDKGMENFLKRQEGARKVAAKVDTLYAQLKEPMVSQLKTLIAQNKRDEACSRYASAARVPRDLGCKVVAKLAQSMNYQQ